MFSRFCSHTRIIGKGFFLFRNNIHSTNSTKLLWTEWQPVVKELNSELTFFWSYLQRVVVVSGNTGLTPLIGFKVIRDGVSAGSVWSEILGSKVGRQIRRKLRVDWTSNGVKKPIKEMMYGIDIRLLLVDLHRSISEDDGVTSEWSYRPLSRGGHSDTVDYIQ